MYEKFLTLSGEFNHLSYFTLWGLWIVLSKYVSSVSYMFSEKVATWIDCKIITVKFIFHNCWRFVNHPAASRSNLWWTPRILHGTSRICNDFLTTKPWASLPEGQHVHYQRAWFTNEWLESLLFMQGKYLLFIVRPIHCDSGYTAVGGSQGELPFTNVTTCIAFSAATLTHVLAWASIFRFRLHQIRHRLPYIILGIDVSW